MTAGLGFFKHNLLYFIIKMDEIIGLLREAILL
jgi:hypothetical protein